MADKPNGKLGDTENQPMHHADQLQRMILGDTQAHYEHWVDRLWREEERDGITPWVPLLSEPTQMTEHERQALFAAVVAGAIYIGGDPERGNTASEKCRG